MIKGNLLTFDSGSYEPLYSFISESNSAEFSGNHIGKLLQIVFRSIHISYEPQGEIPSLHNVLILGNFRISILLLREKQRLLPVKCLTVIQ